MSARWWPLELTSPVRRAIQSIEESSDKRIPEFSSESFDVADRLLTTALSQHIEGILDRDSLPALCHVMVGWGNFRIRGTSILQLYGRFVQVNQDRRPVLLQCDPEGDFHPWQSIAYAVMAGSDPYSSIPFGITKHTSLRELCLTSRNLNSSNPCDLGHLLYSLSYLDPDNSGGPFEFSGCTRTCSELFEMAIQAHLFGGFEVCRKFHLTEGLCLALNRITGLPRSHREQIQAFVTGQIDILFPLLVLVNEVHAEVVDGAIPNKFLIHEVQGSLLLGDCIENVYYYAGHIIELASLALSEGFAVTFRQLRAVEAILLKLNDVLPIVIRDAVFDECFLALGHYRRAMTLYRLLKHRKIVLDQQLSQRELAMFTAKIPEGPNVIPVSANASEMFPLSSVRFAASRRHPDPWFEEVVEQYNLIADPSFMAYGHFDHFRRICPQSWPRSVHYEFLLYSNQHIGIELHIEGVGLDTVASMVREYLPRLTQSFNLCCVEWDPQWWKSRGRLRVIYSMETTPRSIALGMKTLISETFADLDRLMNPICVGIPIVVLESPSQPN
jgi:hypothetical protein